MLNKTDKKQQTFIDNAILVCANENKNIDQIKDQIIEKARVNKVDFSQVYLTNKRHIEILKESIVAIDDAIQSAQTYTADIVDMQTKFVWKILGKITGESETESIIDGIFAKFCLGK